MFIHERDAFEDLSLILDKYHGKLPPAVIHCFTGTAAQARAYIDKGYNIGLTGYLWKDRSEDGVRHALKEKMIPLDRILLETDAPYMFCKVDDKKIPANIRDKIGDEVYFFFNSLSITVFGFRLSVCTRFRPSIVMNRPV